MLDRPSAISHLTNLTVSGNCRLITYTNNTRDYMVPSIWGQVSDCLLSQLHRPRGESLELELR